MSEFYCDNLVIDSGFWVKSVLFQSVTGLVLGFCYIDTLLVFLSAMDEQSSSRLSMNELIGFSGVSLHLSVPLNGASNLTNVIDASTPALDNSTPVKTFKEAVVLNVKGASAKFAQVLSKTCAIPLCQFPKPILKGDDLAIKIPEND